MTFVLGCDETNIHPTRRKIESNDSGGSVAVCLDLAAERLVLSSVDIQATDEVCYGGNTMTL